MKEVTQKELLKGFPPVCVVAINKMVNSINTPFLLLAEVLQMDSSWFGKQYAVAGGPGRTYETPSQAEGKWVNDLPSQRAYFTSWCKTEFYKEGMENAGTDNAIDGTDNPTA